MLRGFVGGGWGESGVSELDWREVEDCGSSCMVAFLHVRVNQNVLPSPYLLDTPISPPISPARLY